MKDERLINEIQHRLLKYCGLCSISKIKNGILHLIIGDIIHLGYIYEEIKTENSNDFYLKILQDLSRNWQRFGSSRGVCEVLESI